MKPETQTQKIILRETYRKNLKTPGLTISFVATSDGILLAPSDEIRSRTGAHGEDIYIVEPPVFVLRYTRSNSRKVRWSIHYVDRNGRERKVKISDVPPNVLATFTIALEEKGLELNPWEEEEGDI